MPPIEELNELMPDEMALYAEYSRGFDEGFEDGYEEGSGSLIDSCCSLKKAERNDFAVIGLVVGLILGTALGWFVL